MNKEEYDERVKAAAKEYASKKKVASQPETQFTKGAQWAWDILTRGRTLAEYEDMLRQDVCDRFCIDEPERWQESLIAETAAMMEDRDGMQADIRKEGRLLEKYDKNMQPYKESNPLYVHLKELQRSIGMQREHLGLSAKAAKKMESPKGKPDNSQSSLDEFIDGIKG